MDSSPKKGPGMGKTTADIFLDLCRNFFLSIFFSQNQSKGNFNEVELEVELVVELALRDSL